MSNYTVEIRNSAKSDLKKIKQSNLKNQFLAVVSTLKENPYSKTQSVEKLVPKNKGKYSRRLNRLHRVVYTVDEENKVVETLSAWTRYE